MGSGTLSVGQLHEQRSHRRNSTFNAPIHTVVVVVALDDHVSHLAFGLIAGPDLQESIATMSRILTRAQLPNETPLFDCTEDAMAVAISDLISG